MTKIIQTGSEDNKIYLFSIKGFLDTKSTVPKAQIHKNTKKCDQLFHTTV